MMRRRYEERGEFEDRGATAAKRARAIELRRNPTPAEAQLWEALRRRALGVKFRRSHVIAGCVVDFYAHSVRLVVEVDGDVHDKKVEEDASRDEAMTTLGLLVVRVRNDDVLQRLEWTLGVIEDAIRTRR